MREISYLDVYKQLWLERKIILKYIIIFFLFGLLIAIFTPKKYKVTTIVVPQLSSSSQGLKLGNLSSIASLAGIDLSSLSSTEAIVPIMYPKVVESLPFQLDLMNSKFYYERAGKEITLIEYYNNYRKKSLLGLAVKYTLGLPSLVMEKLKRQEQVMASYKTKNDSLLVVSKDIDEIMKHLEDDISVEVNAKFGYIEISGIFDDPLFTAKVVERLKNLLQIYITKYKIERAMAKLTFVNERYIEKKQAFEEAQRKLAIFRDRNKNVSTQIVKAEEERLLAEYNLAFNIYNELATQLEQAQIAVKEDTPIFTEIEPTKVPYKKFSPNRVLIIFSFIVLGGCVGVGYVIYKMLDFKKFI
ncbi:MAG: Wzz/FepE/Etk N-terminal domain-containing protein [Bacteroidales bacterium]